MSESSRADWDDRHRGGPATAAPEPFLLEMMPAIAPGRVGGLALDAAAGRGRNSLALARAGYRVVAVDFSIEAMRALGTAARARRLLVWPVAANLDNFHIKPESFDVIVNINFLDRSLFPHFVRALKPAGALLAETFLEDQAAIGHPKNPSFLLGHAELRSLVAGLEVEMYREGLVSYADGTNAYRAGVLARRGG